MKKRYKSKALAWFNNRKLGQKILFAFVLSSIMPMLIIQSISLFVSTEALKDKVDQLMVNQLTQIAQRVDLTLEVYTNMVYQIYVDNQIIDNVIKLQNPEYTKKEVAFHEIYNRLQQYNSSVGGLRCISIICSDGSQVTYDLGTASSIENIWESYADMRQIKPYISAQEKGGMVITPTMRFNNTGEELRLFHISKTMYDLNDLGKGSIATIVMTIQESVLSDICSSTEDLPEEYSINFITDDKRNVIAYPDDFYSGIRINPDLGIKEFVLVTGKLKNKDIAVNTYQDSDSGLIFYNVYDKSYMLRDITRNQKFSVIIGLTAIGFSILMISYTVNTIGKSIKKIITGIKEVQKGNLEVAVEVDSSDEIGQIAENFNTMAGKVKILIEEVTEANERQKNAEIKALEAQINPHFLYNTLDSINWMAIDHEEYEISKMLRNLGVILRYSISKSNHLVTIEELADWLDKYISLQKMRFHNAFDYEIHVEAKVRHYRIFKLLIQPFVENAVIHGFKGIESGGIIHIDISLAEHRKTLNIIIEDNGKGMSQEMVTRYNNREEAVKDDGRSIGLHNAFTRMEMYYGHAAVWNITSIPEVGTVITLKLPFAQREDGG